MNLICLLLMIMVKQFIVIDSVNAAEFIISQQMLDFQRVDYSRSLLDPNLSKLFRPVFFFCFFFKQLFLMPSDGLIDCVDPDCCEQLSCGSDPLCHGSADPLVLLQQGLPSTIAAPSSPSTHTQSFYQRIRFLLGKAATHTLPGDVPFDTRYVLVYSLCGRSVRACE